MCAWADEKGGKREGKKRETIVNTRFPSYFSKSQNVRNRNEKGRMEDEMGKGEHDDIPALECFQLALVYLSETGISEGAYERILGKTFSNGHRLKVADTASQARRTSWAGRARVPGHEQWTMTSYIR